MISKDTVCKREQDCNKKQINNRPHSKEIDYNLSKLVGNILLKFRNNCPVWKQK